MRVVFGLIAESLTIIDIIHHNYLMSEEQRYQRVASKNELQGGGLLKAQVKDKELVLSMIEGKVYAMGYKSKLLSS